MGNAVSNSVNNAVRIVKNAVRVVKDTVSNIFRRLAPPIIRYIVAHPIRTLGHIVSGLLLIVPGVVTGPLLALAGFGGNGIIAGSVAASVQSAMGTISAGSTFAVLQSAAMGSYGAATVAAVASEVLGVAMRVGRR